jgi:hypothetical protein
MGSVCEVPLVRRRSAVPTYLATERGIPTATVAVFTDVTTAIPERTA